MFTSLKSLEMDEFLLANIFDSLHDGVKIIDKDGYILFINRAAERNMNIIREEWIGKNVEEMLPNSIILKALHTGTPQIHKYSCNCQLKFPPLSH